MGFSTTVAVESNMSLNIYGSSARRKMFSSLFSAVGLLAKQPKKLLPIVSPIF